MPLTLFFPLGAQAWTEFLKPILVLNKIDRLIMELKMTPDEAYRHLRQVVEQVNSITGMLFSAERMQSLDKAATLAESQVRQSSILLSFCASSSLFILLFLSVIFRRRAMQLPTPCLRVPWRTMMTPTCKIFWPKVKLFFDFSWVACFSLSLFLS